MLAMSGAYIAVIVFSSLSLSGFSMNLTVPSFPLSPAFCRIPGVLGVAGLVGLVFNLPFAVAIPFGPVGGNTPLVGAAATAYPAGSARLPS